MDRNIYNQHPQLDPVGLARKCLVAGVGGYWLGRTMKWNRSLCVFGSVLPFVSLFLFQEWQLSKELTPYGEVQFNKIPKLNIELSTKDPSNQLKQKQSNSKFTSTRKIPQPLEQKILTAQDFTKQLSPSYFT